MVPAAEFYSIPSQFSDGTEILLHVLHFTKSKRLRSLTCCIIIADADDHIFTSQITGLSKYIMHNNFVWVCFV